MARLLMVDIVIETSIMKIPESGGFRNMANTVLNHVKKSGIIPCINNYSINVSANCEAASSTFPSLFLMILTVAPVSVAAVIAAARHIS
jgi:hypothetical protein